MRKMLILFLLGLLNTNLYSQMLDGYKYAYIPVLEYDDGSKDKYGISARTVNFFKSEGFVIINSLDNIENPCEAITVGTETGGDDYISNINYRVLNCIEVIYKFSSGNVGNLYSGRNRDYRIATTRAFENIKSNALKSYTFDTTLTPKHPNDLRFSSIGIIFSDEKSIRSYLLDNELDDIEGIWGASGAGNNYKLLILKDDYYYKAYIIEGSGYWASGDTKATFEPTAVDDIYTIKWTMADKETIQEVVGAIQNRGLLKFTLSDTSNNQPIETSIYKVFPPLDGLSNTKKQNLKKGEWAGNGSGIIISKSGYIVTNNHVIDDADEIEVEFILNGEVQKFNAEVVQVDKVNDLAIIKIFDMNFDGVDDLPYNFKTRSSEVGTTVYAYGYPMALSAMGKEIKVTDGIINAKSGFDGDITTYQISAPIQKGNSGGPLFDDKGNFIGINAAIIRKDIADNVGYTIKSSYVLNLIDVLPKSIDLPSNTKLKLLPLTEQIKELSKYVVLIKIK